MNRAHTADVRAQFIAPTSDAPTSDAPTSDAPTSDAPTSDAPARDAGLLAALQLGDSLFPSGGFTLSHGLETLAERRLVTSASALHDWIAGVGRWQVATSDGAAAAAVWDAGDDLAVVTEIDRYLLASKLAREPREASQRTGRQMLATLASIAGGACARYRREVLAARAPGLQPVVLGLAGRQLGLGQRETVLLLLHLFAAGCLGAALRLVDVDDVEVQHVRLALAPTLAEAAGEALATPWQELHASAVQTELACMLHERSTMRLFAS
ncbi:MAG: urease accessory UreF family protein [Chloroflexota bacterium]